MIEWIKYKLGQLLKKTIEHSGQKYCRKCGRRMGRSSKIVEYHPITGLAVKVEVTYGCPEYKVIFDDTGYYGNGHDGWVWTEKVPTSEGE